MKQIQALREQRNALAKEAKNILAKNGDKVWTKEDKEGFDAIGDKIELLDSQIDAEQKMLDDDSDKHFRDAEDFRNRDKKPEKSEAAKACELFIRKMSNELTHEEALAIRNTMSTTTGSEGGFTVPSEISSNLIDMLKGYGAMRKLADQLTTGAGNDLSYPTSDGTTETGEWVAQNTPAALADPTFGTRALNVFKAGSRTITIPIELLQDTVIDVVGLVNKRVRDRIGRLSNTGYTVGTGTGQPNGLVTAASVGKAGIAGQTVTIIYDDLVDLIDSLDHAYLEAGDPLTFQSSQAMRKVIRKLKDTAGRPLWTPSYDAGIGKGMPEQLMGYDYVINNDMPVPAANAKSLAFGNHKKYMIRDAMQVTLFRFEDSPFITKGQVGFLAWARTGGNLMDLNAVKLYQHSAT